MRWAAAGAVSLRLALPRLLSASATPAAAQPSRRLEFPAASGLPVPRFVSLKSDRVNLRNGPGTDYPTAWVYRRAGLPLEVIKEFEGWRQVRDADGATGWVLQSLPVWPPHGLVLPWELKAGSRRRRSRCAATTAKAPRTVARSRPASSPTCTICDGRWCQRERSTIPRLPRAEEALGRLRGRGRSSSPQRLAPLSPLRHRVARRRRCGVMRMPSGGSGTPSTRIASPGMSRQLALFLEEEVVVVRRVGVEVGLRAVDRQLAQQAGPLELMQRVVNGRERHMLADASASACSSSAVTCRSSPSNSSAPSARRWRVGRSPALRRSSATPREALPSSGDPAMLFVICLRAAPCCRVAAAAAW